MNKISLDSSDLTQEQKNSIVPLAYAMIYEATGKEASIKYDGREIDLGNLLDDVSAVLTKQAILARYDAEVVKRAAAKQAFDAEVAELQTLCGGLDNAIADVSKMNETQRAKVLQDVLRLLQLMTKYRNF